MSATAQKPVIAVYKGRMEKAVSALKDEFSGLRTGRASTALLDTVHVDAYGSSMPLNQVGAVSVPEARMLMVNVWDRGLVVSVEKAIRNAGLGLNPVVDGQNLRIPIPALTEERRKELTKVAHKYAEQQRVAVRNVRRDGNDDLRKAQKDGTISQDEEKRLESEMQKITDEAIKHIDEILKSKEQEIMHV